MMMIPVAEINDIIKHYGEIHQKTKAAEELSELQTVLLQDIFDDNKIDENKIIEEVADVYIMLVQLRQMYTIGETDIQRVIDYKLNRVKKRIKREKELNAIKTDNYYTNNSDH